MGKGSGLVEIAALFIGVAFAALLIGHPSATAQVVGSIGQAFGMNLATVELAGGYAGSSGYSGGTNNLFAR